MVNAIGGCAAGTAKIVGSNPIRSTNPSSILASMVDVTFDCRLDAGGRDPDSHSPTLRRHHQHLWSKPLPSGKAFHLDISGPRPFLVHRSELGEFQLTSDAIVHRYAARPTIHPLVNMLPDAQRRFVEAPAWPIADCIVFPGKRINGMNTINGARGMDSRIGDRFDLTLECIRRYYRGQASPLAAVLDRYSTFFALFEDFDGYVDFFLLQDLVCSKAGTVKFYLPFDDFQGSPLPQGLESYAKYLSAIQLFSSNRAQRMIRWCNKRGT
jgi:hypothetical protein